MRQLHDGNWTNFRIHIQISPRYAAFEMTTLINKKSSSFQNCFQNLGSSMVQISNKFIADLKALSELDIRLKEFNSLTGTKKMVQKPKLDNTKKPLPKKDKNWLDDTRMT